MSPAENNILGVDSPSGVEQSSQTIGRNRAFGLVSSYVRSLESIRCGKEVYDKLKIALNRLLYASYPLNRVSYKVFHRSLFEPSALIRSYRCKYGNAIFLCPGANSELQFLGNFEPDVKRIVSRYHDGDVVDVGAGFGLYTVMLSQALLERGRVLSIEPDSCYYRFLKQNIALNRCRNVIALSIAAWSTTSKLRIVRHVFGGPFEDGPVERTVGNVDAQPLDQVFSAFNIKPKLVKIDVEGAEHDVLFGMEETLRSSRPSVIFEALNEDALVRCSSFLKEREYGVTSLPDGNFLAAPRLNTAT